MMLPTTFDDVFYSALERTSRAPFLHGEGVATWADKGTFPAAQLTLGSVAAKHTRVRGMLVDLGMTFRQRAWCSANRNLTVIRPSSEYLYPFADRQQSWNKPRFLALSPFAQSVWLEPGVVVVGGLTSLLNHLNTGVFIPQFAPCEPNDRLMYDRLPSKHTPAPSRRLPNTGVLGFHHVRDFSILRNWDYCVGQAAGNPVLRRAVLDADAGALSWALTQSGVPGECRPHDSYNRLGTVITGEPILQFVERVQKEYKNSNVVCFNSAFGRPPWEDWGVEVLPITLKP